MKKSLKHHFYSNQYTSMKKRDQTYCTVYPCKEMHAPKTKTQVLAHASRYISPIEFIFVFNCFENLSFGFWCMHLFARLISFKLGIPNKFNKPVPLRKKGNLLFYEYLIVKGAAKYVNFIANLHKLTRAAKDPLFSLFSIKILSKWCLYIIKTLILRGLNITLSFHVKKHIYMLIPFISLMD
ncbi:hypothetical protein BpHYR1_042136 [Brachionus plicatilis]|uniref:Uncharacterized protein n=1 Tax=Brachionus plicatilis TaxID=10195 RepID=A0A3M7R2E5_BRAPC|nr:hypothetical protein BpHYR1_042136 [Brachionus plicatilis]